MVWIIFVVVVTILAVFVIGNGIIGAIFYFPIMLIAAIDRAFTLQPPRPAKRDTEAKVVPFRGPKVDEALLKQIECIRAESSRVREQRNGKSGI